MEAVTLVSLLREMELTQERAFALAGRLMAATVDARIERNLPTGAVAALRAKIGQTVAGMGEAQARTAEAHRLLEAIGRSAGLDPMAFGDKSEDPRRAFTGA
jgi:hypothetical protein